ncbi:MAG: hypothetical protein Q9M32_07235 [Sulfurimonas sp.]|nr:hypothetical protein [Sulfurimonas sp.]MDQ7061377.1 hypothetical protein [Sulfurimonas sp.]
MNDFKLKLVLATLTGIVFSFIFILLAFVLPSKEKVVYKKVPKGKLEHVSEAFKNR